MKIYKIQANTRVDFYFNDKGFLFYAGLDKITNRDLRSWEQFHKEKTYKYYQEFGFYKRLFNFLGDLPEHFKTRNFYQHLRLETN